MMASSFAPTAKILTISSPAARSRVSYCLDVRSREFNVTIMRISSTAPRSCGQDKVVDQEGGILGIHGRDEVLQDLRALLIRPVVEDVAKVVESGAWNADTRSQRDTLRPT